MDFFCQFLTQFEAVSTTIHLSLLGKLCVYRPLRNVEFFFVIWRLFILEKSHSIPFTSFISEKINEGHSKTILYFWLEVFLL